MEITEVRTREDMINNLRNQAGILGDLLPSSSQLKEIYD